MAGINSPSGEPYMDVGEMAAIEKECSLSAVLPWGGKYPPGVGLVKRDGFDVIGPDGLRYADLHQRILSFSLGGHAREVMAAIEKTRKKFPNLTMVDTTEFFEPATLFMNDLHQALRPHGNYLIQLAATGTGANDQAIRLAMGSLGGQDQVKLLVLEGNYGGAGLYMNSVCEAAGWKGDTSLHCEAEVLKLDGSNIDEVFTRCLKSGKKPILIMEDGVQGVGGFNVLYKNFLREISERVHDAGGKKIYDNVQTFVRASGGRGLFGFHRWADPEKPQHFPDLITFAKGMGDGHGIAGFAVLRSIAEQCKVSPQGPGNTFDTFNRVRDALAAARKVLEISQKERLDVTVREMGGKFMSNLLHLFSEFSGVIKNVVGMGGMTGLEFRSPELLLRAMNRAPSSGILVAKGGSPTYPVMRLPLQFDTDRAFVDRVSGCVENMLRAVQKETGA